MAGLLDWFADRAKDVGRAIGTAGDAVVPGNQANWHKPAPQPVRPQPQAPRPVARVQAPLPTLNDYRNQIISSSRSMPAPQPSLFNKLVSAPTNITKPLLGVTVGDIGRQIPSAIGQVASPVVNTVAPTVIKAATAGLGFVPHAGEMNAEDAARAKLKGEKTKVVTDSKGKQITTSTQNRPVTLKDEVINGVLSRAAFANPLKNEIANIANPAAKFAANTAVNTGFFTGTSALGKNQQGVDTKQIVKELPGELATNAIFMGLTNAPGLIKDLRGNAALERLTNMSKANQLLTDTVQSSGAPKPPALRPQAVYNNYDQPKLGPNSQFSSRTPITRSQMIADAEASAQRAANPEVQAKRAAITNFKGADSELKQRMIGELERNRDMHAATMKTMPKSTDAYKNAAKAYTAAQEEIARVQNGLEIRTKGYGKPDNFTIAQDVPKSYTEPGFDPTDHVSEQTKLQEQAAKGGSKLSTIKAELSTKGLDALSPIEKPVEGVVGRKGAVELRNQLDRSLRSDTIAGQFAKDNGLHDIIKSAQDTNALDQYLIARHAQTLEANGIKTGRNLANDSKLLDALAPQYQAHAEAITQYNHNLLDKTVEYGLISKDTAAMLKAKYPDYVPFDRIFKEGELTGGGNGSGPASLSTQTVIKRIKGSDRQIQSPLESILAKTHDVIAQGERNNAAKEIVKTADLPGNPLSLREISPTETIGNKHTISFLENGKKRVFETTQEVADAAKSLNKQQLGFVGEIMAAPTRVLRLGATGVNPGFALANVVKDTASAFINSEHPLRASIANPKVFLQSLAAATYHGGKNYGELVREGAGGTSFDIARNAAKDTVGKIRAEKSGASKALYTVRHPGELLRAVEDTIGRSEEFGRAIQYFGNKQAALKEGKSVAQAVAYGADAARNNTVNFARAGEYGRVVNSVLPYVNAGVQGSRTLLRNLRDRPTQTATKIAITGFLPVATTVAWALSDPERKKAYDDIQDYEKQGNIIIVPPHPVKDPKTGRWNVIKIPVSQEIANLNNIVRNGVEALHADKNFDFKALAGNLAGTATSLNFQDPRQAAGQLIPQATKPIIEGLTNQNLFTGNKIVPDNKAMLDPRDQYGNTTSGTAKTLGNLTGLSPLHIDNFIRTTSGGAGQIAVNASDNALAKAGAISPEDVRGQTVAKSITNRFDSAAGAPEYAGIDTALNDKTKELKSLDAYKSMTPEDKVAALNRLKNDVIKSKKQEIDAANQKPGWGTDKNGKKITLSDRQKGLLDGKTNVSDYLTTNAQKEAAGISTSTTKATNPKDRYQKALDAYNKDKTEGKVSAIKDLTRQSELTKLKARSPYSQDANDLYDLSYAKIIDYVNNDTKNGKKLWDEVQQLDKSMTDSGYTSKLYDKYGNLKKVATKGGTVKKGRKAKAVNLTAFNSSLRKITSSSRGRGRLATSVKVPKFSTKKIKLLSPPKRIA